MFCPFICVIYFLNAKSNSSGFDVNFTGTVSFVFSISIIGCSASKSILSVLSVPFNHNVFSVFSYVIFISIDTSCTKFLATLI